MLEVHWSSSSGWSAPVICPVHNFSFNPYNKSLQFGLSSSDGFAVYKSVKGQALLFRPRCNFNRFINSSKELYFPKFEYKDYIKCLEKFIQSNKTWIPNFPSGLFIKPLMFTEEEDLVASACKKVILTMIAFPFKPIYGDGPIKLMLAHDEAKSAHGGTGGSCFPANYAYSMKYLQRALNAGYQDVLYMDSETNVSEASTSNFFMVWSNEKNQTELITPVLRGSVFPGVIRDTLMMLAGANKTLKVKSISLPMKEFIKAGKEKRVMYLVI